MELIVATLHLMLLRTRRVPKLEKMFHDGFRFQREQLFCQSALSLGHTGKRKMVKERERTLE